MNIDTENRLELDISAFVGHSVAVLGITSSGKTNTAAVLIEELLVQGLPMTIVDIEGEYYGLKQRHDLLIAGRSEHAELEIGPENAPQLAEISIRRGISVILDLSDYTQDEMYAFLVAYFTRLWEVAGKERKPYQIILEEAHEFIPQNANTPLKQILTRIALRGRKRGIGTILMSQRSAKVEKDVLTQVPLLFLHRVVHPIDLKVYKDLIPLPGPVVETLVGDLRTGQAIVVSNHAADTYHIRQRHTFHVGSTPTLGTTADPELRHIDGAMLQELQALMKQAQPERSNNVEARQAKRILALEALLAEKDATIAKLEERVELLSRLQVAVDSPEKLEIFHATVHSMLMGKDLPAPTIEGALVHTPETSVKTMAIPPLNERKFSSLTQRIAALPKQQRQTLQILTEHEKWMPIRELAAWLNKEEASLSKNPPQDLLRLHLVERDRHQDGFHYRSMLRNYLSVEYPGHDVERLVQRLF